MKAAEGVFMVEEAPEGGYAARPWGTPSSGETLEELREAARDAVRCPFGQDELPTVIRLHRVREEVFTLGSCPGTSPARSSWIG